MNSEFESAKSDALNILSRAPKTKKQLWDKLKSRNKYQSDTIDAVIKYAEEYRYIDDRQYAMDYIDYRKKNKSIKLLLYELKNKGIEDEIIDEVSDYFTDFDASESIAVLIKKKGYDFNTKDIKEKQKMYRFLMSRGFSYNDIRKAGFCLDEYCD